MKERIIQITSVAVEAGPNNGPYVLHTALTEFGDLWQLYQSHGYSNVPTDGLWHRVDLAVFDPQQAHEQIFADAMGSFPQLDGGFDA